MLAQQMNDSKTLLELAEQVIITEGPRSWSKSERLVFATLPAEAREIIQRHAKLDSDAVRRAQNSAALLRKELETLKQKGTD
jgi:hypothetical protein